MIEREGNDLALLVGETLVEGRYQSFRRVTDFRRAAGSQGYTAETRRLQELPTVQWTAIETIHRVLLVRLLSHF